MHNYVLHNNELTPLAQARLSPGQSGLLSGWGLFTTMRIYEGRPFAFERHWERLRRDAERVQLPFPFSSQAVRGSLDQVICANQVSSGIARVYFINNKAGHWHSEESLPATDLLICTSDLPAFPSPTRLALQEHGRDTTHPLTGTKVTSWLSNVWSLEQAHKRGFDEVIVLNERKELAECTAANVFCVLEGSVATPPLSAGCLPGVTRDVLLEIGRDLKPPVQERTLTLSDLRTAQEVFITSTSREVLPVSQVEDYQVPLAPGPVTQRLAQVFSDYVRQYFARQP